MKLDMTISESIALNSALIYAMNNLKGASVRLALRLAYNSKQLEQIVAAFEEQRKKLLDQFGEKDENGELKVVDDQAVISDKDGFAAAFKELTDEKFEIEFKELTSDIFPETIDANIVGGLYPIIVEVEQKEAA